MFRDQGFAIYYHGDFDWGGCASPRTVVPFSLHPWRYETADYAQRPQAGASKVPLSMPRGIPCYVLPWKCAAQAVHEEAVLDSLLSDLEDPDSPRHGTALLKPGTFDLAAIPPSARFAIFCQIVSPFSERCADKHCAGDAK